MHTGTQRKRSIMNKMGNSLNAIGSAGQLMGVPGAGVVKATGSAMPLLMNGLKKDEQEKINEDPQKYITMLSVLLFILLEELKKDDNPKRTQVLDNLISNMNSLYIEHGVNFLQGGIGDVESTRQGAFTVNEVGRNVGTLGGAEGEGAEGEGAEGGGFGSRGRVISRSRRRKRNKTKKKIKNTKKKIKRTKK